MRSSDPSWRPGSYWVALPTKEDLIGRVRGAERRQLVASALETGDLEALDPEILREALSAEERRALLQLHPQLALGEYLPDLEDQDVPNGEVEIARLYLNSGIGNTISVRARRSGAEIALRAVDEFEDKLSIKPDRVAVPLTNAELLSAVKTLEWHGPLAHGQVWWTRELEGETDLEAAGEFISGESQVYPAFADYVDRDNREWLQAQLGDVEGDEGTW